MRGGKCVEPPAPEQVGRKGAPCKNFSKRTVPNIESSRVGTERRHNHAVRTGREAAPHHDVAAPPQARSGMQMAGDFTNLARGLVPEHDSVENKLARKSATKS